ncbi:MAG TPA: hypothetical protein VHM02_00750 [Thermoanaerobaculia bacterium]|nr:hypothetical protein [Thermoanaerobaculia bacterium]
MPRPLVRPLVLAAAATVLGAAAPAAADWIVVLDNGSELVSRYQPEEASWDSSVVLVMTAEGNMIGLSRDEIASVTSDIESRGFGTVIDDKTIALGWAPNDQPVPEEGGEAASPELALLQQMLALQAAQAVAAQTPGVSVQQFVDPSAAGGGIPSFGIPGGGGVAPGDFGGFQTGPLGPPGIVTAPPSTALPIPTAGSLPFQGSSLPVQGTSLPVQSAPVGGIPAGGTPAGGVPGSGVSP